MYEFKCDQEALKKAIEIAGGMHEIKRKDRYCDLMALLFLL